jgi:protein-S-isoprenylcysteine O-methyltransferase Ste14
MREVLTMRTQPLTLLAVIGLVACWSAVALAWLGGAIYYEPRSPAERAHRSFVSPTVISTVVLVLLFATVPRAAWLSLEVHVAWIRIMGLVILLAATALTVWARLVLGAMWSAAPTVKQEHKLRTSGPYAITRHPIYTGLLGMLMGSMLLAGGGRWIAPFAVYLVGLEFKIRIEERLMLAEFPEDYPRYRRLVPRLVPGLRLIGAHRLVSG